MSRDGEISYFRRPHAYGAIGSLFRAVSPVYLILSLGMLLGLLWSYWDVLKILFTDWQQDDNYSAGQLVPIAALFLVWRDRAALSKSRIKPCLMGLVVILLGMGMRVFGLMYVYESAERYSMILTVYGLVLFVAGPDLFKRMFWILLFLVLMIPLPGRIHNLISGPLQSFATWGAVFALEMIGLTVDARGNVILLNDSIHVAVSEACNGLRMLTAFIVVTSVLAYVVKRPRWEKAVLMVSGVAIAILCNMARLLVTAVLYLHAGSEIAERFFHDFAGMTMMPLAVGMLLGELWVMKKLIVPEGKSLNRRAKPKVS